jgi:D-glycero-D-manno-heptose 1,7-bisphosphate phosphatase
MKNRAVFLDRDGTINKDVGYPRDYRQIHIYPFAYEAIRDIRRLGFRAVVVTNQSGVGRGLIPEKSLRDIHRRLEAALGRRRARLDGIYYCPHFIQAADPRYRRDCACRKPKPGLARRAAASLGLDLKKSYMIGDHVNDILFGLAIGAVPILVLTGHGKKTLSRLRESGPMPAHVAQNLRAAVGWIARREKQVGTAAG